MSFYDKWKAQIGIIAGALGALGVTKLLEGLGEALHLGDKFLGVMKGIQKLAVTAIVITLQYSLQTELFSSFIDGAGFKSYIASLFVGAIGTGILYSMWGPTGLVIGLGVTAAASLSAIIENGGITNTESALVALTGFASAIGAVGIAWKKLGPIIKESNLVRALTGIKNGSAAASSALTFMFPTLTKIVDGFLLAWEAVVTFVGGLTAPAWAGIAAAIAAVASVAYFLYENWEKVKKAAKDFFAENIAPKLEEIKGHFENMIEAFAPLGDMFTNIKKKVSEFFSKIDWSKLAWIGDLFEGLGGIIFSVVSGVIAGAFNTFVGIIEGFVQAVSGIVQIVAGVVRVVVALFSGDLSQAWEAVKQIGKGIADVFGGLWDMTVGALVDFVDGVIGWFVELWDELVGHSIVPDTIDAIVEWFLSLPDKILGPIKKFTEDVIARFKAMWENIKSWFSSNVAPKFTKEYWQNKFDSIRNAASTKLEEFKKTATDKWNSVKSWFTSNVAPKFTASYWQTKFDTIRSGLKTKLDAAWKAVKNFFSVSEWKKKVTDAVNTIKKNFKMPSLPKIKLSVTWSTNVGALKTAVYKALGLSGWPSLKWSTYAKGGFPSMGEMFIAREAGPELVGRIGNRPSVANNDQIVTAVAQGVYSAVVAAMSENNGGNGNQNINVYLDGKQIYASVKKTESRRGANLMGNQLGYVY
jgi:phage-related protein